MKRLATLNERLAWQKVNAAAVERSPATKAAYKAWLRAVVEDVQAAGRANIRLSPWSSLGSYVGASFDEAFAKAYEPETSVGVKPVERPDLVDGKIHALTGDNTAFYFERTISSERAAKVLLSMGSDDAIKVWINGKLALANKVTRGVVPGDEKVVVN